MNRGSLVLVFAGLLWTSAAPAGEAPSDLNDLSMEVSALQTLHQLRLTPAQLKTLKLLSKTTREKDKDREKSKEDRALRKALVEVREAILAGKESRIDAKVEKLEEIQEKNSDLDDDVTITAEARKYAPEVLRILTPRQAAGYLAAFEDDWKGPVERIQEALRDGQKLDEDDWKELRDETADEVAWLLAGSDSTTAAMIRGQLISLLNRAKKGPEKGLQGETPDVAQLVARLAFKIGPVQMLQNAMLRDLAELLSNPRLGHAAEALLDARKK